MNRKTNPWIGILVMLSLIGSAAVARQGNSAPPKAQTGPRIGQFRLESAGGELNMVNSGRTKTREWDLAGSPVTLTSERYDVSALRMILSQDLVKNKVTTGRATGKVRIVVRDQSQNIVLTCDTAVYHFAAGDQPTHIDVNGNVRAVVRDKYFTEQDPLVLTGESGTVEFPDNETTKVRLKNPTGGGTPIEQEPKKKTPGKTP